MTRISHIKILISYEPYNMAHILKRMEQASARLLGTEAKAYCFHKIMEATLLCFLIGSNGAEACMKLNLIYQ